MLYSRKYKATVGIVSLCVLEVQLSYSTVLRPHHSFCLAKAACRDLKLMLAPQAPALDSSPLGHQQMYVLNVTSSTVLEINSLLCLSVPVFLSTPLIGLSVDLLTANKRPLISLLMKEYMIL